MSCKVILKVLMVIINSAILIAGVGSLTIGIYIEINTKQADGKPGLEYLANAAYTLIAIGCILTIIGFQGCCGAFFENKGMLMTFFIIILITIIVEVVAIAILLSTPKPLFVYFISVLHWDITALMGGVASSIVALEIAAMIVSMVLYQHLPGKPQMFSATG